MTGHSLVSGQTPRIRDFMARLTLPPLKISDFTGDNPTMFTAYSPEFSVLFCCLCMNANFFQRGHFTLHRCFFLCFVGVSVSRRTFSAVGKITEAVPFSPELCDQPNFFLECV